jgi:hypothetical protein
MAIARGEWGSDETLQSHSRGRAIAVMTGSGPTSSTARREFHDALPAPMP